MTAQEIKLLAGKALHYDFSHVDLIDSDAVLARCVGHTVTAGGATVPQKLRALSLIAMQPRDTEYSLSETPRFSRLGIMLDLSRGGVMRVEKVREFLLRMALFGANELLLYMEDTYVLEDYPYFGYLRGAYSDDELRAIDDYAATLGIEVIPCIQTLGHLQQYLSWNPAANPVKDTNSVLLCDAEETYRLIDAMIRKMSSLFRSRLIHIGMDEAHDVGFGNYRRLHGVPERFSLLTRHLSRVTEICESHGMTPMMWSDMFFNLAAPSGSYYDPDFHFTKSQAATVPQVQQVYWDYYHSDPEFYRAMIARHKEMKQPTVFAGGSWTWSGFLAHPEYTFQTMLPALQVCIEEGVSHVFATLWGDDGCETDYFDGLYGFAAFSEYCYRGTEVTQEEICAIGTFLSGISEKRAHAMSAFSQDSVGKRLIWGDLFWNQTGIDFTLSDHRRCMEAARDAILDSGDEYTLLLLNIAIRKATIYGDLHWRYQNGNSLLIYCREVLPALLHDYRQLKQVHEARFLSLNKGFGWERIQARYDAAIGRIEYACRVIGEYTDHTRATIEELDTPPQYGSQRNIMYHLFAQGSVPDCG